MSHSKLFVTAKMLELWDESGSKELLGIFEAAGTDHDSLLEPSRELLLDICARNLNFEKAIEFFRDVITAIPDFIDKFADILWLYGLEIEGQEELLKTYRAFLPALVRNGIIDINLLKERLEVDLLKEANLVDAVFGKNIVRVKTKLLYTQQKYNLFIEENEGYAKLITELIEGREITNENVKGVIASVDALIGQFDLDPNRVLDIVLEGFELNLDKHEQYIRILEEFKGSNLPHILGFKFHFYQGTDSPGPGDTPESLYIATARLIQAKMLSVSQIWPHLSPDDDVAKAEYDLIVAERQRAAGRIGVVSLNESRSTAEIAEANAVDSKCKEEIEAAEKKREKSQKLGLLMGQLSIGDVESVEFLMNLLKPIEPCSYEPVSKAVCSLISRMIQPLYSPLSSRPSVSPMVVDDIECTSLDHLGTKVYKLLLHIGMWLSTDVVLFTKLCRVIREWAKTCSTEYSKLGDIVARVLLPALTEIPKNPGASYELYEAVIGLPWQQRYEFYSRWMNGAHDTHYTRQISKARVADETKKIMKRVVKENTKAQGRLLGKLAHCDPYTPLAVIIGQVQAYDNMIVHVVECFKYLNNLSFDMLVFVLIQNLSMPDKQLLKPDGLSLSDWLQSISMLCAQVCSKYPNRVELGGLLQHLLNQLMAGSSFELIVLKDLVTKMAGLETAEDISSQQAEALAGGAVMRKEGAVFASVMHAGEKSKEAARVAKSTSRLVDVLSKTRLAVPLLIAIAQVRSAIVFTNDVGHLKLISDMYDKCHEMLIQLTEFLSLHNDDYAEHMPPVPVLVKTYHMPPEVAFFVARPALSNLLPSMDVSPILNADVWKRLTPQLYRTFWELDLSDICVPRERYSAEIEKHNRAVKVLDAEVCVSSEYVDPEDARAEKKKRAQQKAMHEGIVTQLEEELKVQEADHHKVIERLKKEKDEYFPNKSDDFIIEFLQDCVLPRLTFSPADALYTSRFIALLHTLSTPNFSIVKTYDRLLKDVSGIVFSCTVNESSRLGRFLVDMLSNIAQWKSDGNVYEKECLKTPGFAGIDDAPLSFEQFLKLDREWHRHLTKAFVKCLESSEFMEVRNALVVLTQITQLFPKIRSHYKQVLRRAEVLKNEEREDLRVIGASYHTMLMKQEPHLQIEEVKIRSTKSSASLTARVKEKMASLTTDGDEQRHREHRDRRHRHRDQTDENEKREREDVKGDDSQAKKRRIASSQSVERQRRPAVRRI